jgi:hypothetical protein
MAKITEQQFITKWWRKRFPNASSPTFEPKWNSAISCADACDLLKKYKAYLKREGGTGR